MLQFLHWSKKQDGAGTEQRHGQEASGEEENPRSRCDLRSSLKVRRRQTQEVDGRRLGGARGLPRVGTQRPAQVWVREVGVKFTSRESSQRGTARRAQPALPAPRRGCREGETRRPFGSCSSSPGQADRSEGTVLSAPPSP